MRHRKKKNHILTLFKYPQPQTHPRSTQIQNPLELGILASHGIIIQAHMWAFALWAGPHALCIEQ